MAKASIPLLDLTADETLTLIKTGYTLLHRVELENPNTTGMYLQLFDAAAVSDVTLGVTTPTAVIPIPAGDGTENGIRAIGYESAPPRFYKGLVYAVTTTATGSTGPTTELPANFNFD